jgi:PHO85 cyclin-1
METQLLGYLQYDLRFDEDEACRFWAPFIQSSDAMASTRALALDNLTRARIAREGSQSSTESSDSEQPAAESSRLSVSTLSLARTSSRLPVPRLHSSSRSSSSTSTRSSTSDSTADSSVSEASTALTTPSEENVVDSARQSHMKSTSSSSRISQKSHIRGESSGLPTVRSKKSVTFSNIKGHSRIGSREHGRKASDSSSIRTLVGNKSPSTLSLSLSQLSLHTRRSSGPSKPPTSSSSMLVPTTSGSSIRTTQMSPSVSLPTFERPPASSSASGFLSRMWGAAKGQALGQDKGVASAVDIPSSQSQGQAGSTFRRLILPSSRSKSFVPDS